MTIRQIAAPLLSIPLTIFTASAHADSMAVTASEADYAAYAANVRALDKAQQDSSALPCAYADADCGKLVHAVFDPAQALVMQETYQLSLFNKGEKSLDDVSKTMFAISSRYKKAFDADPKRYEAEYLDSTELEAQDMIRMKWQFEKVMLFLAAQKQDNKNAQSARMMVSLSLQSETMLMKVESGQLKQSIEKHQMTPAGEARAARIVDSLEPIRHPSGTADEMSVDLDYGARLYLANCAACHQRDGHGITGTFPDLTASEAMASRETTLFAILKGGKGMPGWDGALLPQQVAAVENYVRLTLAQQKDTPITANEAVFIVMRSKGLAPDPTK